MIKLISDILWVQGLYTEKNQVFVLILQAQVDDILKSLEGIFREEISMSRVPDLHLEIMHATFQWKYFQISAQISYTQLFDGDTKK